MCSYHVFLTVGKGSGDNLGGTVCGSGDSFIGVKFLFGSTVFLVIRGFVCSRSSLLGGGCEGW